MADAFDTYAPSLDGPASLAFAITPGASPLATAIRRLYVGGAGNVTVTMLSGASLTFAAVPAGEALDLRATHVTAATATGLVGLTDPAPTEATGGDELPTAPTGFAYLVDADGHYFIASDGSYIIAEI